jgi:hypothetical protein
MPVIVQITIIWVLILCHLVSGSQHFIGTCCLHLQGKSVCGEDQLGYISSLQGR